MDGRTPRLLAGGRGAVTGEAIPPGGRVVAFVDLGTNSVRLLIVRLDPNGSYAVLTRQKETIRLGEGEFETGLLQPAAMERAVLVCSRFMEVARGFSADEVVAVATSASREAQNRDEFLALLRERAGIAMRVISGVEEARLIHLGVASGGGVGDEEAVFIDIGGGSTEVSVGTHHSSRHRASLRLGAIRLSALFPPDGDGRYGPDTHAAMRVHVLEGVRGALGGFGDIGTLSAFGSSGTIENLAAIAGDKNVLTYNGLCSTIRRLIGMTLAERRVVAGMNPERADIIVGGAVILEVLMAEIGIPEMRISDRGVREGLLIDYLSGIDGFPQGTPLPVRRQGVLQLARLCRADEGHSCEVVRLALRLFDTGGEVGLHSLGETERELLEYAALLHDAGTLISFRGHQNHSCYIIENASLPGLSRREVRIIAQTARFHRKKPPTKKVLEAAGVAGGDARTVRILSSILRIAENLDRSHRGFVRDAVFEKNGNMFRIVVTPGGECDLEIWGLRDALQDVEKGLGKRIDLVIAETD
ncbi:Ppx/GppA phosphatase family protein [Methanofollis fontis]|nr:Ppx/GppA phosphatase family protein [Methanofollis fontis]